MAHAYTPGLRVTKSTILRKERRLPLPGEVIVKVGDRVEAEDIVARTHLPGNVKSVNVANKLSLPPSDVAACMTKKVGNPVEKDEVIAQTKTFFGLFTPTCVSPIKGTIESISKITGQVLVREMPIPVEMRAYIDGQVIEILPDEGVVVESGTAFIQGIFGIGGESGGEIKVLVSNPSEILEESLIDSSCKDKLLVGGSLVTEPALKKAVSVGAKGIVVGGLNAKDLKNILGYDIGVAITGSEKVGVTLVITEGFGGISMASRTFDLLKSREGEKASINGATQIRAGVIRPEVIIPLAEQGSVKKEKTAQKNVGMTSGHVVRIIREPNFGMLGEVLELPAELEVMESETKVRVLRARLLKTGEEVTIPRANVEIIES
ncbi:MAG: hypothetical protein B6244_13995 [Candidatus Cloacimonetes bacterium 4572_55]|nr:MAG: hypothetical protein B6244_13995 [Candidatus Cloacimonetes bacterium 4572_55]